jgi:hypothetical protein
LTIDPYTTNPAKIRNPLTNKLVPIGFPLILLNSCIFVVICVNILIEIIPIIKQIKLDMKARVNQSNKVVKKSDGTAINIPLDHNLYKNHLSLLANKILINY